MTRNDLARVLVVVAAAFVPFARGLANGFVWDDQVVVGRRLAPAGCGGLGDVWRQPYWGQGFGPRDTYRPLSLSLLYLERRAFGMAAAPYRAVGLGLHAAVSVLVLIVLGRLAGARVGLASALLFAAHPVHAEAVATAYGQLELVAALFVLATVGLYARARHNGVQPWPFVLAVACAAAAACSKESALVLPALLMLVRAAWLVDDGDGEGDGGSAAWARRFARGLGWDVLFVLAAVPYLMLRYRALGHLVPEPEATITLGYTFAQRVKAVVIAVGEAVRLCTLPTGQGLYYGHLRGSLYGWPYAELTWVSAGALLAVWLAGERGRRAALFGAGWFLVALFPVMNFIPTGVLVAERTLYMPSLGVCFLAAAWLGRLSRGAARSALAGLVLAGAVAGASVVGNWRDQETLWRTTIAAHPRSPLAHLSFGQVLVDHWQNSGAVPSPAELDEAAAAFDAAYRLNPRLTRALVGRGVVAARQGDRARAEQLLRRAVAAAPDDPVPRAALRALLDEAHARAGPGRDVGGPDPAEP
jgi:protein O-mannosyl-transferase